MKMRRAAIKEYLRAATRIAKEINKSCQRTWTLAHVRIPVNPRARTLSGSRSKRLLQFKPKRGRLSCSSCPEEEEEEGGCCEFLSSSFTPLLLLLLDADNGSGRGFRELKVMEMVEKCCGWYRREWIESDDEGMKLVNPNMLISLFFLCYRRLGMYVKEKQIIKVFFYFLFTTNIYQLKNSFCLEPWNRVMIKVSHQIKDDMNMCL